MIVNQTIGAAEPTHIFDLDWLRNRVIRNGISLSVDAMVFNRHSVYSHTHTSNYIQM
jgi:hypothetical protein